MDLYTEQRQKADRKREYELAAHLLARRESEVSRIKRELHDRLGPLLFAIGMNVKWTSTHCPPHNESLGARLQETTQLIEDAVRETRRLSSDLRSDALNWGSLGLEEALCEYAAELEQQSQLPITFSSALGEGETLDPEVASHIYYLVSEALAATVQRPEATKVHLRLERTEEALLVIIKHEEKGETSPEASILPLLTLQEMHVRAQLLGGILLLHSPPEGGMTISLSTPLPKGERV